MRKSISKRELTPSRVLVFGYVGVILLGTILLALPASSSRAAGRASLVDACFTASSAVCVTGLVVRDTQYDYSPFGRIVILLLVQVGGLGYMTLATSFSQMLGRKVSMRDKLTTKEGLAELTLEDLGRFALKVFAVTVGLEAVGATVLFLRFLSRGMTVSGSLASGVFHSICAFCNAGFSSFSRNLLDYRGDAVVVLTVVALLVIGGLGFSVLREMYRRFIKRTTKRISVHSKLVLSSTAALLLIGFAAVLLLESGRVMAGFGLKEKLLASLFQGATPRTAGFNTLDIGLLAPSTLFVMTILMFIGASPGGTGGGVKTTTFCSGLLRLYSILSGREHVSAFGRRLSDSATSRALALILAALLLVSVGTGFLLVSESRAAMEKGFLGILFEEVSAFGTVGLSVGSYTRPETSLSHDFSAPGKLIVSFTMLVGRVGPLTLGAALVAHRRKESFAYPEGMVPIG